MKTYKSKCIKRFFAVVLSIFISCPYVFAGEVGVITSVEGRVDVLRVNSETAAPLREGEAISVGDAIRTKSNSKAEVTFNDKSILRLAHNSRVEVKDYQLDKNNNRKTANIMLDRGKARTIIAKMPGSADFVISTPNSQGRVKGSDIFAFYQAGNSGMLVAEGKLSVANIAHPESELIVPAGTSVLVPLGELPKGPRQYFELEKKLHEKDTDIPKAVSVPKGEGEVVIKGVISKMSGDVKITKKGDTVARPINLSDILDEGDKIVTGANGSIEIRLDNGNVLNLKPNTELVFIKLTMDIKTGEYENSFYSSMGKIRARIENLKGKSTFKVRTPTAVSGARGTIMYMDILPSLTTAFFEGGGGYLNNLISGINKILDAGQNASADGQGNVSDPDYTSDADREAYGEGWDPGSGTEGYSAPEGTTGSYLYDDDTGAGAGPGGADTPETGGAAGGEFFDDLPITETGATGGGTTPTKAPLVFDGDTSNGDEDGSFDGD